MSRKTLTPSQLYAILDREFRKRRPDVCASCKMPLPFYREPPDEVSANWHIGTPTDCPHLCNAVIAEILANAWSKYDLVATEQADD